MSDDFSMGSALDLSSRMKDLAESQNSAVDQAKGNVQQAQGKGSADKQAAWIKAQSAKLQAARAQIDVKQAGSERKFAMMKTLINWGFKQVANTAGAISDRMSNDARARAAVENGAAGARRLQAGGAHTVALGGAGDLNARMERLHGDMQRLRENTNADGSVMTADQRAALRERIGDQIGALQGGGAASAGLLNFGAQRELVDMRREILNSRLQDLQQGGSVRSEDQPLAKNLRDEMDNLRHQSELLAGMEITRGAFNNLGSVQLYAGAQHGEGDGNRGQAAMGTFLRAQGADERLQGRMQELSQLQDQANELRDKRAQMTGNRDAAGGNLGMDQHQQNTVKDTQKTLDQVMADQESVRSLGPAADYVNAMDEMDRLQNTPGTDPGALADAAAKVRSTEWDFNASRNTNWKDSWLAKTAESTLGDAFTMFQQLQQLNKQYAQAQAQASAASQQAGDAMEQARDMELS
jgi:hypothetical protein